MISSCRSSIWKHRVNIPLASVSEFLGKENSFQELNAKKVRWLKWVKAGQSGFQRLVFFLSRAFGQIKWHFCEGYEAGKIRDDLLHRGTVKPRGGKWRKSGE